MTCVINELISTHVQTITKSLENQLLLKTYFHLSRHYFPLFNLLAFSGSYFLSWNLESPRACHQIPLHLNVSTRQTEKYIYFFFFSLTKAIIIRRQNLRQPLSDCQFHEASFSLSSVKIERIYLSHGIKMKKKHSITC